MEFHVQCELDYTLNGPATFLLALKCIQTGGQKILREDLRVDPLIDTEEFKLEVGMNRFSRLEVFNPGNLKVAYQADVTTSTRIVPANTLNPNRPAGLNPEAIPFLFPSRYCQSDRLRQQAYDMFGHLHTPHELAAGISDWIHDHVTYVSGSSGETSSAIETMEQRQGVCRDFAHLGIALCRSMCVPARYVACYAHQLNPPDFHACFEVFIDGWWYIYDATRLAPLNGLVRIATGRDAADAAVCTIFGSPRLDSSQVSCQCSDPNFTPVTRDTLAASGEVIAIL